MKRNHDDDQAAQLSDTDVDHNTEHAAVSAHTSTEPGAHPHFAEREPWVRSGEQDVAELSTHFGTHVPPKKRHGKRRLVAAVALLAIIISCVVALQQLWSTLSEGQRQDQTALSSSRRNREIR